MSAQAENEEIAASSDVEIEVGSRLSQWYRRFSRNAHGYFFKRVHRGNLIYNTSWEDPRIDRQLLKLGSDSRVVMITSAGCNALDYLLDSPREIHAVDVNRSQNALLLLKKSLIERGSFDDLFAMFGRGWHESARELIRAMQDAWPEAARKFWQRRASYFEPSGFRPTFYFRGTAGAAAWLFHQTVHTRPRLKAGMLELFDAQSLDEQKALYAELEPRLWGPLTSWMVGRPAFQTMLGVPPPQLQLIADSYPGGLVRYIQDKIKHVFTNLDIQENYFWRVYAHGRYTESCCPNYLRAENLEPLRSQLDKLRAHDSTLTGFLNDNPGQYTHFVLLDHQDWFAHYAPAELEEEWRAIFKNAAPGARVLMRSAGLDLGFLPAFARKSLRLFPDLTSALHLQDRVGTYGSTHLAEIV